MDGADDKFKSWDEVAKAAPPPKAIEAARDLVRAEQARREALDALGKAQKEVERTKQSHEVSRKRLLDAVEREESWGKAYVVEVQQWVDGTPIKDATYEKMVVVVEKDEHPRDGTIHRVLVLDAEGEV